MPARFREISKSKKNEREIRVLTHNLCLLIIRSISSLIFLYLSSDSGLWPTESSASGSGLSQPLSPFFLNVWNTQFGKVQSLAQAARKTQQCYSNTNCPAVEGFTLSFRERKWPRVHHADATGLQLREAGEDRTDPFLLELESVDKEWSWQSGELSVLIRTPARPPQSIKMPTQNAIDFNIFIRLKWMSVKSKGCVLFTAEYTVCFFFFLLSKESYRTKKF